MRPRLRIINASASLQSSSQISHSHPKCRILLHQHQIRTIRSILKPPPKRNRYDHISQTKTPDALDVSAALDRRQHTTPFRTGLLARKVGMAQTFDPTTGTQLPCTILQVDRCQVIGHKTQPKHGYWAVQVGCGWKPTMRVSKCDLADFAAKGVSVKEHVREFKVRDGTGLVAVGSELHPSWFKVGQLVDARGVTKGKGFAGGMKRHGFSGQPASHGQSLTHRTMGSAGASQGSGSRVLPGKKMAGRMGGENHTVQHLEIIKVDDENGIILVKGCVSGAKRSIIELFDSKKRPGQLEKLSLPTIPLPPTHESTLAQISTA